VHEHQPYIAQLLYRYQCVTVPSFGAFLTEIQSAQWVEGANSFSSKKIAFNANLKQWHPYCCSIRKTSYDYAVSTIQHEV
jgi:hypothetical protein